MGPQVHPKNRMLVSYPTVGDLPASGIPGSVAIVEDDGSGASAFYFWDSNVLAWITAGAGGGGSWEVVKNETVLAGGVPLIDWVTDIDGDTDEFYKLWFHILGITNGVLLTFNGDNGAFYTRQVDQAIDATASAAHNMAQNFISIGSQNCIGNFLISTKQGTKRGVSGVISVGLGEAGNLAITRTETGSYEITNTNIDQITLTAGSSVFAENSRVILERFVP